MASGIEEKTVYDSNEAPVPKSHFDLNVGGRGPTQRRLRSYQISMIGLTGGLGTGLFIGTGAAYAKSGPAGLLLAYGIVGMVLWSVMQSIAELAGEYILRCPRMIS